MTGLVSHQPTASLHKIFTVYWVNSVAAVMRAWRFQFQCEDIVSEKREVKMTQLLVTSQPKRKKAGEYLDLTHYLLAK